MIRPLTSLRFFAALAVFGSHLSLFAASARLDWVWSHVLRHGYAGVTFFFILSGFILAYAYAGRLRGDRDSVRAYLGARVGRIWPVHLLTLVLAIPVALRTLDAFDAPSIGALAGTFVVNAALVQAYFPSEAVHYSFNAPSWSLGNEMLFYALLPFLLAWLARRARPVTTPTALLVAVAVWLVSLAAAFAGRDLESAHWLFYVNPVFRLGDFAIGVCLALVYRDFVATGTAGRWTRLEVGALALGAATLATASLVPASLTYGTWYQPAFAAIVFVFAVARGGVSQLLATRPLVYLGEISFVFYMLHLLAIGYVQVLLGSGQPLLVAVVALTLTLLFSAAIHHWYEDPLRHRIARAAKGRRGTSRPSAATGEDAAPATPADQVVARR